MTSLLAHYHDDQVHVYYHQLMGYTLYICIFTSSNEYYLQIDDDEKDDVMLMMVHSFFALALAFV